MTRTEEYKDYWLGVNAQYYIDELTIIKMSYPRCFIRLKLSGEYCSGMAGFYSEIVEVQWFDGDRPIQEEQNRIMVEAWNFLLIEKQIMENKMAEIDEFE